MGGIIGFGAAELAQRIRVGDTSPLEVVDAHIARIEVRATDADGLSAAPTSVTSPASRAT